MRSFEATIATRHRVPLWGGFFGPSGSGKSCSVIRVGLGIARENGGELYVVDSENGRALAFADEYRFRHVDLSPPFSSTDYLSAVQYCVGKGAACIVVDSGSHEHSGPGGYIDTQEKELARLSKGDPEKAERVKMLSWTVPSKLRQQMISGLLQLNTNILWTFRAKEKTKPVRINGKTEVQEQGWQPIAGPDLLFEMTLNVLLMPASDGTPTWAPEHPAERAMIKLPMQFRELFAKPRQLDEEIGASLARWAKGDAVPNTAATTSAPNPFAREDRLLAEAAAGGGQLLLDTWAALPNAAKRALKSGLDATYKPIAAKIDAAMREGAH